MPDRFTEPSIDFEANARDSADKADYVGMQGEDDQLCSDCPPPGFPSDATRCHGCPLFASGSEEAQYQAAHVASQPVTAVEFDAAWMLEKINLHPSHRDEFSCPLVVAMDANDELARLEHYWVLPRGRRFAGNSVNWVSRFVIGEMTLESRTWNLSSGYPSLVHSWPLGWPKAPWDYATREEFFEANREIC